MIIEEENTIRKWKHEFDNYILPTSSTIEKTYFLQEIEQDAIMYSRKQYQRLISK